MRRLAAAAVLLPLLAAACGDRGPDSGFDTGIRGVVLAGPQCPVQTVESPCPDLPLPELIVRVSAPAGDVVAEAVTDAEGRFEVSVAPGDYVVLAVVEGAGPMSSKPVDVTVPPGGFAQVTLPVDTGIR